MTKAKAFVTAAVSAACLMLSAGAASAAPAAPGHGLRAPNPAGLVQHRSPGPAVVVPVHGGQRAYVPPPRGPWAVAPRHRGHGAVERGHRHRHSRHVIVAPPRRHRYPAYGFFYGDLIRLLAPRPYCHHR